LNDTGATDLTGMLSGNFRSQTHRHQGGKVIGTLKNSDEVNFPKNKVATTQSRKKKKYKTMMTPWYDWSP